MAPPPTPEELAARRAAEQAAAEHAAAQAAANAAAQQAAQEAAQRLAAQEAANRLAVERLAEERLRLERSLHEPMDVDTSLVFPLPQGSVAQVDFGQSWKTLTWILRRKSKNVDGGQHPPKKLRAMHHKRQLDATHGDKQFHANINRNGKNLDGAAPSVQPEKDQKMGRIQRSIFGGVSSDQKRIGSA